MGHGGQGRIMTEAQREALENFAQHIGYFAEITRHHMKRSIPVTDRDAINEVHGIYTGLVEARDHLLDMLRFGAT